ncbi:MAG TPA: PAS domain-containing sensor histidine kinase [Gemmatimonadaceae bacterium]|nr:PAS domain-containing sensor histidine kinase [Gemmatimonadaceae bacterium]
MSSDSGGYVPTDGAPSEAPRRKSVRDAAEFAHARRATTPTTEAEGLYRLLVETVRDYAIFVLDPDGYILSWNAGAERIKGWRADQIIGKHFSAFYREEDIERGKPDWELEVAAEEGRFEDEGWRVRADGSLFWANVIITALRNETGRLVGFAKVTRDLTERRAAQERAIEDARRLAEAEASSRAKSGFLAMMSHELRTPLNAIGGYTELLLLGAADPLTSRQREFLERIRRSQQHLLAIINDLLNFSRIEAGQVSYDLAPVPLREVVTLVTPMIEPQATAKRLSVRCDACEPGVTARADRVKVEQILLNLLSNAIKFTGEGGAISISCAMDGERALLRVSDTGQGIPASDHEAIFEPFVQVGRGLTHVQEGTGLGLAISRDLARAMDGDLTVRSDPGKGATFTLSLPAA